MAVDSRIEGIVQIHIRIQRIILRFGNLLGDRVVERCRDLHLVGEEFTQFERCRQRVRLEIVGGACCHTVLQAAEALGDNLSGEVDGTEIRQLHIQGT